MRSDALSRIATPGLAPPDNGRSPEVERAALYARVMGMPGGSADQAQSNRAFQDLWLRFVSAVSLAARQPQLAGLAARATQAVGEAAGPRMEQAKHDMWQVVDSVATLELGGAKNTARCRALALAGGAILEGLAQAGGRAGDSPLADACEVWLAVSTVGDDDVERLSRPDAARAHVDAWSRSLFEAVGLPAPGGDRLTDVPPPVTALFAGPAGTGKTLAAHLLGCAAGKDVYRIDLGAVVSRYIGETEKNLDRAFAEARDAGAVLLFDEGDALLGKRTDVKDAHDRYADAAVDALAARLGRFDGTAVVATHHSADTIDPRLLDRVDARVVRFPLPPR